jgi:serine/threonine-protein kinase
VPTDPSPGRRLESWKEIAAYLKKDVSTVRRWEAREGLPIHRHVHARRDSIYAHTAELDSWLEARRRVVDRPALPSSDPRRSEALLWSRATIGVSVVLALGLLTQAGSPVSDRSKSAFLSVSGPERPDPAAQRFYLRGRRQMEARTRQGFELAVADFQEAARRDPSFARAYSGLSDAYGLMAYYRFQPPRMALDASRTAALLALKLDDTLAEAHASLAGLLAYYDWDWSGAEREYRRAIDLDPSFAPARHWYSNCLSLMGRHDEAIAQARKAVELQPLSLIALTGALGNAYELAGQHEQAAQHYRTALEFDRDFGNARIALASHYWRQGKLPQALQEMEAAADLSDNPSWMAQLAALHAAMGQREDARRMLDALEAQPGRLSPVTHAAVYVQLGDPDRALEILERAAEARDPTLPGAKREAGLTALQDQPRFQALLRLMNLS